MSETSTYRTLQEEAPDSGTASSAPPAQNGNNGAELRETGQL